MQLDEPSTNDRDVIRRLQQVKTHELSRNDEAGN